MPTSVFNPTTGEQRAIRSGDANWNTARNAATSTANNGTTIVFGGFTSNIQRVFIPFDTSSIPDTNKITSATLEFYRDDSIDTFRDDDLTRVELVQTAQASGTAYVSGDYDSVSFTSGGTINFADTTNNAYNTISLNATALTWISKTGFTKLALITGKDYDNVQTLNHNELCIQNRVAANPMKLTVNHQPPPLGFRSLLGVGI